MSAPLIGCTAAEAREARISTLEAENARLREERDEYERERNQWRADCQQQLIYTTEALQRAESAERQLAEARRALEVMNAVVNHQTDRSAPLYHGFRLRRHPLTCGNDSNHTPLFPFWNGHRVVLICRDCDYTQDNAAMFDNATLAPAEKPGEE